MRIKIVGENDCARATRHLLRKAGFAVTAFLPAEVVIHGPHAGYLITIELAPAFVPKTMPPAGEPIRELAPASPDHPASEPGFPPQDPPSGSSQEASVAQDGADASAAAHAGNAANVGHVGPATAGRIHFDSADGALEAAILRHVAQLSALPVVVDRPGGVVHSERELRIVIPRLLTAGNNISRPLNADDNISRPLNAGDNISRPLNADDNISRPLNAGDNISRPLNAGDLQADPAAAAAVEFGVLRGLLDLLQPSSQEIQTPAPPPAQKKWWKLFVVMLALAGSLRAAPVPSPAVAAHSASLELHGVDGSFLALHMAPNALFPQLQAASGQIFSSVYDSGNTALKVNCVVGCSATSGFSDNGAFTPGSTAVNNISAVFNDSIPALTSGNAGALRATSDRMLYVNIGKLGGTALSGANVVDSGDTAFRVNCVVGCSASAGFSDSSAFSAGATAESNIGGVYNDGLAAIASGDAAAVRITANRAMHVNLRNASGAEIGTSGAPVRVDPTGTTTQPVSGSVTANAGTGNFSTNLAQLGGSAVGNSNPLFVRVTDGTNNMPAGDSAARSIHTTVDNAAIPVTQSSGASLHVDVDSAPTTGVTQSGAWSDTVTQASGANLHVDVDSAPTTAAAQSGSWNVGQTGTWTVQPGNTANTTPWLVSLAAPASGGCAPAHLLSAATTNSTNIKASAGTLCSLTVINTTGTIYYLKFYDKATAPTCNTDTVVQTIPVPAGASGAGAVVSTGPYGWAFSNGIGLCLTGGLADNDNTSAAAGVAVSYSYK